MSILFLCKGAVKSSGLKSPLTLIQILSVDNNIYVILDIYSLYSIYMYHISIIYLYIYHSVHHIHISTYQVHIYQYMYLYIIVKYDHIHTSVAPWLYPAVCGDTHTHSTQHSAWHSVTGTCQLEGRWGMWSPNLFNPQGKGWHML